MASAAEEAAQEQHEAEEAIRERLPREVLNLHRRLERQQTSVDSLQGNISRLTDMVA
jgi:predicted RNase H-like nuclease (RuvC/YqgF family)